MGEALEKPAFLDEEAVGILLDMTNRPFAKKGKLWLHWLCSLELIPGGWVCRFYLEDIHGDGHISFSGTGNISEAVKNAYSRIDKEWLEEGFREGEEEKKKFRYRIFGTSDI